LKNIAVDVLNNKLTKCEEKINTLIGFSFDTSHRLELINKMSNPNPIKLSYLQEYEIWLYNKIEILRKQRRDTTTSSERRLLFNKNEILLTNRKIEDTESVKRILSYCNTWENKSFLLEHKSWLGLSVEEAKASKENMKMYIKDSVENNEVVSGVYIYIDAETKECLYIGKSKSNMHERLFYHYLESVSGEFGTHIPSFNQSYLSPVFMEFFESIRRNLQIYLIEIENSNDASIVKQLLLSALNPKWISFIDNRSS